jgi:hypothetical protein
MAPKANKNPPDRCFLLDVPREIRDLIGFTLIADSHKFLLAALDDERSFDAGHRRNLESTTILCVEMIPLMKTCRQLQDELSIVLRIAAFHPDAIIKAHVYNFDFRVASTFVKSLRPHEIEHVNRHKSLLIDLLNFSSAAASGQQVEDLLIWAAMCENIGIHIRYQAHWTIFSFQHDLKNAGIPQSGKEILNMLDLRSVGAARLGHTATQESGQRETTSHSYSFPAAMN